ncbi:hypothetical protein F2P81_024908 [Scophthalmus maximus]|uniref:Uncharacterized protein n=1 Tax=Scophthalmus maximus TaxID=52904 RepID=A0A6A4RRJ8_SCOMX|nr:hypothetical protein F2P81_024908 [Scophthalmus maximus]
MCRTKTPNPSHVTNPCVQRAAGARSSETSTERRSGGVQTPSLGYGRKLLQAAAYLRPGIRPRREHPAFEEDDATPSVKPEAETRRRFRRLRRQQL